CRRGPGPRRAGLHPHRHRHAERRGSLLREALMPRAPGQIGCWLSRTAAAVCCAALALAPARAQTPANARASRNSQAPANDDPPEFQGVELVPSLGAQVPLDTPIIDWTGKTVPIGKYFNQGKPVALSLVYYNCPLICPLMLQRHQDRVNGVPF